MSRADRRRRARGKRETYCREFTKVALKISDRCEGLPVHELMEQPEIEKAYIDLIGLKPTEKNLIDDGLRMFVDRVIEKVKTIKEREDEC